MGRSRRFVLSALLAIASMTSTTGSILANVDWCSNDPPVHVTLPSGAQVQVNVHVSVPRSHARALHDTTATVDVVRIDGAVATLLVRVVVPQDGTGPFPIAATAQSFKASNTAAGTNNTVMTIPLTAWVPSSSGQSSCNRDCR